VTKYCAQALGLVDSGLWIVDCGLWATC
jgi:hypothetical protein